MAKTDATYFDALDVEFPGTKVPIKFPSGKTVEVTVHPVGIQNLKRFTAAIGRAMQSVSGLDLPKLGNGQVDPKGIQLIVPLLIDVALQDCLPLIQECCQPSIARLPHWYMPPIVEAWFLENFGAEERVRPWVAALEKAIFKATKQQVSLWETACKVFSKEAILASISSSAASGTGSEKNSPTADGRSPSSGGTPPSSSGDETAEGPTG